MASPNSPSIPNLSKILEYSFGTSLTSAQRAGISSDTLRIGLFGSFGVGKSALACTLLSYATGRWNGTFPVAPGHGAAKTTDWASAKLSNRASIYDNRGMPAVGAEKALKIVSRQLRGLFGDNSTVDYDVDLNWWQRNVQKSKATGDMINAPILVIDASDQLSEPSDFKELFQLFKDAVGVDAVVVMTKTDKVPAQKDTKVSAYAAALNIHPDNIFCVHPIGSEREWEALKGDPANLKEFNLLCSAIVTVADNVIYKQSNSSCVLL